jgi:hypothetical protein
MYNFGVDSLQFWVESNLRNSAEPYHRSSIESVTLVCRLAFTNALAQ